MRNRNLKERATAMLLAVTMILSNTALPSLASEQIAEPAAGFVEMESVEDDASNLITAEESAAETPAEESYTSDAPAEESYTSDAPAEESYTSDAPAEEASVPIAETAAELPVLDGSAGAETPSADMSPAENTATEEAAAAEDSAAVVPGGENAADAAATDPAAEGTPVNDGPELDENTYDIEEAEISDDFENIDSNEYDGLEEDAGSDAEAVPADKNQNVLDEGAVQLLNNAMKNDSFDFEVEDAFEVGDASLLLGEAGSPSQYDSVSDYAKALYEDEPKREQISVNVTGGPTGPVYAGDTLKYNIGFQFMVVPVWGQGHGLDKSLTIFDTYKENLITINLPAGLLLENVAGFTFTKDPDDPENINTEIEHTYTVAIPDYTADNDQSEVEVSIYVCNNGKDNSIRQGLDRFKLTNAVSFSSSFTILDKIQNPYQELKTYTQTVYASPADVETTTPDVWGVEKKCTGAALSSDKKSAVFTWKVDVGLMNGNSMLRSISDYNNRLGRDELDSIYLKDSFTELFSKTNAGVTPSSVTIRKEDGTPVSYTNGSEIELTGDLALNRQAEVDTNGDGKLDYFVSNYTTYYVTATYPVTDEMIADFSENTAYTLSSDNTAKITRYTLADLPEREGNQSKADGSILLPVKDPATLKIEKYLEDYMGSTNAYQDQYGAIAYILSAGQEFTVYSYDSASKTYSPVSGMSNVRSATLEKEKTYYLSSGIAYEVTENLTAEQSRNMKYKSGENLKKTPAQKDAWTAKITNVETKGKIVIRKKDDAGKDLGGAVFTLKNAQGGTVETLTTNDAGTATSQMLPYGTYTLEETSAPLGYVKNFATRTITIDDDHKTVSVNATNKRSFARITLTKYVGLAEDNIINKANQNFAGTFVLQRTTTPDSADSWKNVTTDKNGDAINTKTDKNGMIVADVDAFDSDGKTYSYRFRETIPEGYYDPATGSTTTSDSLVVTLVKDGKANPDPVNVSMYNRKFVKGRVTKNFYDVQPNGTLAENAAKETTVQLFAYTKTDYSDLHPYNNEQKTVKKDTWAEWDKLPVFGPDGNGSSVRIHYLVKEIPVEGYSLDETATGNIVTVTNGQYAGKYIEIPIAGNGTSTQLEMNKTLYNVQTYYPVQIWKKNYYTEEPLPGAKVTIKDANGDIARDAKTGQLLDKIPVQTGENCYVYVYLKAGQTYAFEESENNTGLEFHSLSDKGKITLPSTAQTYANKDKEKNTVRTIWNAPKPKIQVEKKSSVGNTSVSGAVFTVYTLNSTTGKYEPVMISGSPMTVTGNGDPSTSRLTPGDYYFAETTVPAGYLDPNKMYEEYHALSNDFVQGQTADGTTMTFAKGKVENMVKDGTKDNICSFTFVNIPNTGSLKVLKYIDGSLAKEAGFMITVTGDDGTTTKTQPTLTDGSVKFTKLPVYDQNGRKIKYTITETLSVDQKKTYYKVSDGQIAQLKPGKTTDKDTSDKTLIVHNATRIQVSADKVERRSWEYSYTGISYPMDGATVGLFVKDGNNWKLVPAAETGDTANPKETADGGRVTFTGLERGTDYILVELASGDPTMFPYNAAANAFLEYPPQGAATTTIANSDLSKYNVLQVAGTSTTDKNKKKFEAGTMVNANHWLQLHIKKWLDADSYESGSTPVYGKTVDKETDKPIDHAVFVLYRYVVPEGQTSVTFDPDTWTYVGTYTSGTLYNSEAERQKGEFMTQVEEGISDRYVYMLVETDPGPANGAVINPYFEYTFWEESSKNYTVVVPNLHDPATEARIQKYTIDAVNDDDILNAHVTGTGEGVIYLASLRLAKWQDSLDKTTGKWKENYTALPNAEFELRLPGEDGKVLAVLTSGLDAKISNGELAFAQSGTFRLKIGKNDDGNPTYALVDYQTGHPIETNVNAEAFEYTSGGNTYTGYRILTKLVETKAPEGYSYVEDYDTYLCFFDLTEDHKGESWVFNDAYFVKTKGTGNTETLSQNQAGTSWYITDSGNASFHLGDEQSPLRIVDYPIENTMVSVRKFGYKPSADTLGMTSTQLDAFSDEEISRVRMDGVTMVLQKMVNGAWKPWDYRKNEVPNPEKEQTFETNGNGSFTFPNGLQTGTYRIFEKPLGDRWKNTYENAYPDIDHARVFTVTSAALNVSMYNPGKVDLTLIKQDMKEDALSGMKFKLTGTATKEGTTGQDGKVTFSDLATGTYKLQETMAGYSSAYLQQYLKSVDSALEGLAGNGVKIGYEYEVKGNADSDQDVAVKKIIPSGMTVGQADLTLTIRNPKTTSLKLIKSDETTSTTKLKGAQFRVFYRKFDSISEDISITLPDAADTVEETAANFTTPWTSPDSLKELNTDENGVINIPNADPGIYVFYEVKAPEGYDIIKDTDGKPILYTAVVTGGLHVNVTVTPETATIYDYSGTTPATKEIKTCFTNEDGTTAEIEVKNRKKITLKAKKEVNSGKLKDLAWSVTLNLYEDDQKQTKAGTVTITQDDQNTEITFKDPSDASKEALFSPGRRYYLEEVVNSPSPAPYFVLNEVLKDGAKVDVSEATGLYLFPLETLNGFTITVKNNWMRGKVTFTKLDSADMQKQLSGAEFEVRIEKDGKWVKLDGATVTELLSGGEGTGEYAADIPLVSADKTKYRIYETKAPDGYILNKDLHVETELSLKDNVDETGLTMDNTQGDEFTIIKYDNIYGAENHLNHAAKQDAEFTVYQRVDGAWEEIQALYTDENGKISYTRVPGGQYAVAETGFNTGKYLGLDGVYDQDGKKLKPETITVGGKEIGAYTLPTTSGKLELKAYNTPKIVPRIVKKDVGGYPENVTAMMDFAIYEVASDFAASDSSVEALLADESKKPVFTGTTTTITADNRGTYTGWESDDASKSWNPSKTYLLVETLVKAKSGTYDTMNKDDKRVLWYRVIDPVSDPEPDPGKTGKYSFELDNVCGKADLKLAKSVVESTAEDTVAAADTDNAVVGGKVESLLTGSRKVVYTLKPEVTGTNQALSSFVLKDTGLTFVTDAGNNYDGPLPTYSITGIKIGAASHKTENLDYEIADTDISAKVTFTDAEDAVIGTPETVTVSGISKPAEVTAPAGARKFTIDYFCNGVKQATSERYTLGYDFTAGPVEVLVTVDKLKDGTVEKPLAEVKEFTNTAASDLVYPKWKANGSGTEDVTISKESTAKIEVNTITRPRVKIEKSSRPSIAVQAGGVVEYTIIVTNLGEPDSAMVDFIDPVVLDMLPTGVTYIADSASVSDGKFGERFDLHVQRRTGEATLTIPVAGSSDVVLGDPETAVIFELTGTLKPKSFVEITFEAEVAETAVLYGGKLENDAFLSSSFHMPHTISNPHGYSFENDRGFFPGTLPGEAASLSTTAKTREGGLHEVLGSFADADAAEYIWVKTKTELMVNRKASITLKKAVWGDQDEGFNDSDAFLGSATRTNHTPGDETDGWVNWRLTASNGTQKDREWLVMADVIPRTTDKRETVWNVIMDSITAVKNDEKVLKEGTDYFVYYYTGSGETASDAVEEAVTTSIDWASNMPNYPAWPMRTGQPGQPKLPDHWVKGGTDYTGSKEAVTAFAVVFNSNIILKSGKNLVLTYHTTTDNIESDKEFAKVAFENANNVFVMNYNLSQGVMTSNLVSVTLMDSRLAVEGDLWIDEDWDNIQETGVAAGTMADNGNRRDYSKYKIINTLKNAISFSIIDNRHSSGATKEEDATIKEKVNQDGYQIGYGESVRHFRFEDLGAARHKGGQIPEYIGDEGDKTLNIASLKTTDPYNYILEAKISNAALLDIFRKADPGPDHYMSNDPDVPATGTAAYMLDDNFLIRKVTPAPETKSGAADTDTGVYETKPFYLRNAVKTDQTKDLGFRMIRWLEIEKQAADNSNVKLEGVEFQMFGPFGENKGTAVSGKPLKFTEKKDEEGNLVSYTYDPENGTVTTLKTNAKGRILITGLNWWKEYVLKETKAAPGYSIAGATASADASAGTVIASVSDGVWTLKLPSKDKEAVTDKVIIENPREVEVPLEAEKTFETYSRLDFTFKFDLKLTKITDLNNEPSEVLNKLNKALKEKDPIETKEITYKVSEDGSDFSRVKKALFSSVKLYGEGIYTFTITEQQKTNGTDANGTGDAVTYDPVSVKKAVVTVEWDDTAKKLVAHTVYPDETSDETQTGEGSETGGDSQAGEGSGNEQTPAEAAKFKNTYDAENEWLVPVKKKVTVTPSASTTVKPLDGYKFEVVEVKTAEENGTTTTQETVLLTGESGSDGMVKFRPASDAVKNVRIADDGKAYITYQLNRLDVGTHTYLIRETNPQEHKDIYYAGPLQVVVTVAEDTVKNGVLTVAADPDVSQSTPYYERENVYPEAEAKLEGFKILEGRDLENGEFTFELYEGSIPTGELPAAKKLASKTNAAPDAATGKAKFEFTKGDMPADKPALTYTLADVERDPSSFEPVTTKKYYTIVEKDNTQTDPSVKYDESRFIAEVTLAYANKELTADVSYYSVDDQGEPVLMTTDVTFNNKVTEKPEITKYVNEDLHDEIKGFNRSFQYDIIAYITKDANQTVITDTFAAKDELTYASESGDVKVWKLGTKDLREAGADGKKPLDAKQIVSDAAAGAENDISGSKAVSVDLSTDKKEMTVTIDTSKESGDTTLRGQWVQVRVRAILNNEVISNYADYDKKKESGVNTTSTDLEVKSDTYTDHEGISNTASYHIAAMKDHSYEASSNQVTVTPPATNLKFRKYWTDQKGNAVKWPKNEHGEELNFTFHLTRQATGQTGTESAFEDTDIDPDTAVLPIKTNTGDARYIGEFTNLPVYLQADADDAARLMYKVEETDAPEYYKTTYVNNPVPGDDAEFFWEVTNTSSEEPEIAKTVNKDVHAKLAAFDEVFTYDVIAYITKDADTAEITDTLVNGLKYVSAAADVVITDLGTAVDYHAGSAGSFAAGKGTAFTAETAAATQTNTTIIGKTLTIRIGKAISLRGHYVKVTFQAQIDTDVVKDMGDYASNRKLIENNGLVISEILKHEGIANEASYRIEANNGGTYDSRSNTVTVEPTDTFVNVRKVWLNENEEEIDWPEGVKVEVTLYANDTATERKAILDANHPGGSFTGLPVLKNPEVAYSIRETGVSGLPAWYETESVTTDPKTANGFIVTNKLLPSGEAVTPKGKKYYEGGTLTEGQFTFSVRDAADKVVSTGKSKANGTIEFTTITFKESDLGDEESAVFYYTVTEDIPAGATKENGYTEKGITYDPKAFTFKVTLSRLENGYLTHKAEYPDGEVSFTNKDVRGTSFTPTGTKTYENGTLTEGAFTFRIKDANDKVVSTGKSKADGTIAFTSIRYKESDLDGKKSKVFKYTVTEDMPGGATKENKYTVNGITYDPSVKKLNVKVEIGSDGTMSASLDKSSDTVNFKNTRSGGGGGNTPGGGGSTPGGGGGTSVKTGDETPIMLWTLILLMAMTAAAGTGVVMKKRRKYQ